MDMMVIYINDMPGTSKSNIRLFADDIIMYLAISTQDNSRSLEVGVAYGL